MLILETFVVSITFHANPLEMLEIFTRSNCAYSLLFSTQPALCKGQIITYPGGHDKNNEKKKFVTKCMWKEINSFQLLVEKNVSLWKKMFA